MKKLTIISFALTLVLSAVAMAQYAAQQPDNSKSGASMKADKDSTSWTISNPDAVKGHEGHHVTLQAHVDADKNEVHVVGLKMAKDTMQ